MMFEPTEWSHWPYPAPPTPVRRTPDYPVLVIEKRTRGWVVTRRYPLTRWSVDDGQPISQAFGDESACLVFDQAREWIMQHKDADDPMTIQDD